MLLYILLIAGSLVNAAPSDVKGYGHEHWDEHGHGHDWNQGHGHDWNHGHGHDWNQGHGHDWNQGHGHDWNHHGHDHGHDGHQHDHDHGHGHDWEHGGHDHGWDQGHHGGGEHIEDHGKDIGGHDGGKDNGHTEKGGDNDFSGLFDVRNAHKGDGLVKTPDSYRHRREAAEIESRWGSGHDRFSAGHSGKRISGSSLGHSLQSDRGHQHYIEDDSSKVSASKASSSGSSKSSKIKSETVFGGGTSSYDNNAFLSNQNDYLNLGVNKNIKVGGGLGGLLPGISASSNVDFGLGKSSSIGLSNSRGRDSYFGGQTKTEIDQQESSQQSQSETYEASNNRRVNAGAGYDKLNNQYQQNDYNYDANDGYVFSS